MFASIVSSDSVPRFMAKHGEDVRRLLLVMGTDTRGQFIPAQGGGNLVKTMPIKTTKSKAIESQKSRSSEP